MSSSTHVSSSRLESYDLLNAQCSALVLLLDVAPGGRSTYVERQIVRVASIVDAVGEAYP
jgi:hypothetical protein